MLFSLQLRKGQTSPLLIIKPEGSDKFEGQKGAGLAKSTDLSCPATLVRA